MPKVKKTQILRDSLEDLGDEMHKSKIEDDIDSSSMNKASEIKEGKATVENEEGETLEVLYDPIFKCYYDPKTNTYYEMNK